MKILNIKTLKGPNYWSNYRTKLTVIKLDLEEFECLPTNLIKGFSNNLKMLIPSLASHHCSRGVVNGFLHRLEEGTWLGHVIEHVALELQTLAGMDCGFGRTYGAFEKGVYHVIFSHEIAEAGIYAAKAAFNIVERLTQHENYLMLQQDIQILQQIYSQESLGPSTNSIIKAAEKRGIPWHKIDNKSLIILGQGNKQKRIWATVSSHTSAIGVDIAADKELTKQLLASHFIPVPKGKLIRSKEELESALNILAFPLVIKPYNGNHGRGITCNITNREKALCGYELAKEISPYVILESFLVGRDYRFLLINFKVVAVAERTPAQIIGDGKKTIQQLIIEINQDARRGEGHENFLTTIKVDKKTLAILNEKSLTLTSILGAGEVLHLKDTANLSAGGSATDVTDKVHPYNLQLAERVAHIVGLNICGIDIISENIQMPLNKNNGAVIEVNAGPGFRMHLAPTHGSSRNVGRNVIAMLYPEKNSWKIPIVAVTGTNGKTTVVRLLARLAQQANYYTGFTTTEGVYINEDLIYEGDCSGSLSAKVVLQNPQVNFAVLECARGGILRAGLGFKNCEVSIITNITSDHLGLDDIHSLQDMARVKAVVAHSTKKDGYAILNAENDLCYAIKKDLKCKVALFSMRKNERIESHYQAGGLVIYLEKDLIVARNGNEEQAIGMLKEMPLTFNGTATCMIQNILPCILAGMIFNFSLQDIRRVLHTFTASPKNTPGRMNIFDFKTFQVMLDYAHNEGAYIELKNYLTLNHYKRKIGIISATGDRREEDIQKIGYYASQLFDEIIIKHNANGRGRTNQELTDLLLTGIQHSKVPSKVSIISNEFAAVQYAINQATPGTFIFYSPDKVLEAISYINKEMAEFNYHGFIMKECYES